MLTLTVRTAKANFFDRDKVKKAVDDGMRRMLSKFGSFVRQRSRTSLRYRQNPSKPGNPPSVHRTLARTKTNKRTGVSKRQLVSPLREFVFFVFDQSTRSVVIGPALLNWAGGARVLRALEYGGTSLVFSGGKRRTVFISARPFMRPAFEAELRQVPDLLKGLLRR
jgi:hypothetical protein